jgi:serine/threonine-protein kinase
MYYFAPEQLRGEALDHRAAIFSLGAVLYEMATEQKAFAGSTAEQSGVQFSRRLRPCPTA